MWTHRETFNFVQHQADLKLNDISSKLKQVTSHIYVITQNVLEH